MRVLIADDHPLYREAARNQIEQAFPAAAVVEAGSLDEVLASANAGEPFRLVLLDLLMPGMAGAETVGQVVHAFPGAALVMISGTASAEDVRRAVNAGARGFVPKWLSIELFRGALAMVLAGGTFLPAEVLLASSGPAVARLPPPGEPRFDEMLTMREREVLTQLASGASNKEIGRALEIAEITVKLHVRQILRKIQARNRSEAVAIAARSGLL